MSTRPRPYVLFASAAGAGLGFGHLVRCGAIADALGVRRELALRGSDGARDRALAFGWTVHAGPRLEQLLQPDVLVVDEPSRRHRDRWIRRAQAAGVPVVALLDASTGLCDADLVVDGSFAARRRHDGRWCTGPAWMLLAPSVAARRRRPVRRDSGCLLIALGGGAHVARLGAAIAGQVAARLPAFRVEIAAGFVADSLPELPSGCRWIDASRGLADALAGCQAAVVNGGVTMYEACALGTPAVAVPVVAAQRRAIDAAAVLGAVAAAAPGGRPATPERVVDAVARLLAKPALAAAQGDTAARLVDARGLERFAARVADLLRSRGKGARHAA